ncbi:MAG: glycerol kinase [Acidocella sp. 35-58-6]|nr:MAG: glycerol kinase [Acidocella sp. 35-58-6]
MTKYIGAIDQGTSSSRFIIFDKFGQPVASAQKEHRQIFPQPGWVEHDPLEILNNVNDVVIEALGRAKLNSSDLDAVGITNQRETTVLWDRQTGQPLYNALVWQDTRVEAKVASFIHHGGQDQFRSRTGLPLTSYFSGLKLNWLLETIPEARNQAGTGNALFGTMDTWLTWNLTGQHVTDVTNASRTQLMNIETCCWDQSILTAFDIPLACLPTIRSSSEIYGIINIGPLKGVTLAGLLGDQQAALVGQTCFKPGEAKNTYGTGSFLLMNTGTKPVQSAAGLLTTVAYQFGTAPPHYALEGAIAITGALVQWLRDNLHMFETSAQIETLASSVPDNGDVYIVPAFSGLYAPHWRENARGIIAGLTRYANRAHIARAALEATAFQVRDVVDAMAVDSGIALTALKTDGGMVANELLLQFQADILNVPVIRPTVSETTALGAAYAAGLAVGFWNSTEELCVNWSPDRIFMPTMDERTRSKLYASWHKAVLRSFDWIEDQ